MELQKETKAPAHGRWYDDACGTAFAMELIGERWALLVVRELMLGGRRFSDLRASLTGISAKVLTERLDSLEKAGAVVRRRLPPPVSAQIYELTEWGYQAEPAIQELGRWAARSPLHDPTLPLSPVSFMLSLRTMFDARAAKDIAVTAQFAIGESRFAGTMEQGAFTVDCSENAAADLSFAAPEAPLLAALFYGDVPATELAGAGLSVKGDPALLARFLGLFELPPKTSTPCQ